ncbi:hypothetical protein Vadar_000596 [Vaccinium darrowii]|uniref:Uncharacterized protein n=1 Tax=Vaccinium darrowii TaxID=229202 RepID=A0ACB7YS89_9ERIC|nr:hypothetical protein Vadar_000596 [Vaccinium darrowii]
MGMSDEQLAQLFPRTLSGMALRWLMKLDKSKTRTWEDVGNAFVVQYSYNQQLDVTTCDLETTRQFITHWRGKANKMTNRPREQDQVRMVIKNLQTHLKKHLIAQPIRTLKDLFDAGIQVEDAIHSGDLDRGEIIVQNLRGMVVVV